MQQMKRNEPCWSLTRRKGKEMGLTQTKHCRLPLTPNPLTFWVLYFPCSPQRPILHLTRVNMDQQPTSKSTVKQNTSFLLRCCASLSSFIRAALTPTYYPAQRSQHSYPESDHPSCQLAPAHRNPKSKSQIKQQPALSRLQHRQSTQNPPKRVISIQVLNQLIHHPRQIPINIMLLGLDAQHVPITLAHSSIPPASAKRPGQFARTAL